MIRKVAIYCFLVLYVCSLSAQKQKSALSIGSVEDQALYAFHDEQGGKKGFTVDLVKAVMQRMNRPYLLNFYPGNKDSIPSFAARNDIWVSYAKNPYSIDCFQSLYISSSFGEVDYDVLVYLDNEYTRPKDLVGKRIAMLKNGFISDRIVQSEIESVEDVVIVDRLEDGVHLLVKQEVDYFICYSTKSREALSLPDGKYITVYPSGIFDRISFLCKDKQYRDEINQVLSEMRRDGSYDSIYQQWLGEKSPSLSPVFLYKALSVFLFFLLLLLVFIFELKRRVKKSVLAFKSEHEENQSLSALIHLMNQKSNSEVYMFDEVDKKLFVYRANAFIQEYLDVQDLENHIHPDDIERYKIEYQMVLSGLLDEHTSSMRIYNDQKMKYEDFCFYIRPILSDGGKVNRYYFTKRNETESRELIRKKEQIIDTLNLALKSTKIICWTIDVQSDEIVFVDYNTKESVYTLSEGMKMIKEEDHPKCDQFIENLSINEECTTVLQMKLFDEESYKPYEVSALTTKNKDGEIVVIHGITRDISESYNYQKALTEKIELLETIEESLPVGMSIYDETGQLLSINGVMAQILGVNREKMLQVKTNLFRHSKPSGQIYQQLIGGETIQLSLNYNQMLGFISDWAEPSLLHGEFFELRCTPILDENKEVKGFVSICIDNTQVVQDNQKITDLQNQMMVALDAGKVTILHYNSKEGRFYVIYGESHELNDILLTELKTRVSIDVYELLERELDDVLKGKSDRMSFEFKMQLPMGTRWGRLVLVSDSSQANSDSLIGTYKDITKEIAVREKLRRAKDKAEASEKLKMAFLANMSHEIRTPLNAIVGFSEMIQLAESSEERKEYMGIVNSNTELLLRLVNDILDLSKIESGASEVYLNRFNVVATLQKLYTMFDSRCSDMGVELRVACDLADYFIVQDENRIMQVWTNFLLNAIKYTSKGSITIGLSAEGNRIKIWIEDTGKGISSENQPYVFQRFQKFDSFVQGTGLGLAICKGIAEMLGGDIGFSSDFGKGSVFWASFPVERC